jgi:hypothetical protein
VEERRHIIRDKTKRRQQCEIDIRKAEKEVRVGAMLQVLFRDEYKIGGRGVTVIVNGSQDSIESDSCKRQGIVNPYDVV